MARQTEEQLLNGFAPCSIFRTIACVGDSLSSGELVSVDPANGQYHYNDIYEYSWGQFIGRSIGSKVYNFSRGGMTAKWYLDSFADEMGFWNPDLRAQAYIVALGVNDLINAGQEIGTVDDIDFENYNNCKDTFAGLYGKVLLRYKEIQPRADFFLVTMCADIRDTTVHSEKKQRHCELLREIAAKLGNAYVLDLYHEGPYFDMDFVEKYEMNGHMSPIGYMMSAEMIKQLWDKTILENLHDFDDAGFIGTDLYSKL